MGPKVAFVFLLIAFAMLWFPIGQHAFLFEHWMKVGTFMAPFLLLVAFSFKQESDAEIEPRQLSVFLFVAYVVHQFEEHWIDLYGRFYAFKPYLNSFLSEMTGKAETTEFMSEASIFVINTSLVWLVAALAIWRGSTQIFATLCLVAIVVVNSASHIIASVLHGSYNPGLATAVFLFLPLGFFSVWKIHRSGFAGVYLVLAAMAWGLTAHVIMIAGILIMGKFEQIPEMAYFALLVAWSVLPVCIFRATKSQ
ncbi:MAG: HXXEE domain-containing protein [Planctomycetota bacterium]